MANNDEKLLRLEEMGEAIDASLANLETILSQQHLLLKVVEDSEYADAFTEFISETKAQCSNLDEQKTKLIDKKLKLNSVLKACQDPEKAKLVLLVFETFGIFE